MEKAKIIVYCAEFKDDLLSESLIKKTNLLLPENFQLNWETGKKNQQISFWAKVLLNQKMDQEFGVKDALKMYVTEANGKPYFQDGNMHFNYSHSGNLVVLAFCTDSPIGIDIQQHKKVSEGVINRITTDAEKTFLHASTQKTSDFFDIWCRKEAVVKCSGVGIKTGLSRFSALENTSNLDGSIYHLHSLKITDNFSFALASTLPIEQIDIKHL